MAVRWHRSVSQSGPMRFPQNLLSKPPETHNPTSFIRSRKDTPTPQIPYNLHPPQANTETPLPLITSFAMFIEIFLLILLVGAFVTICAAIGHVIRDAIRHHKERRRIQREDRERSSRPAEGVPLAPPSEDPANPLCGQNDAEEDEIDRAKAEQARAIAAY